MNKTRILWIQTAVYFKMTCLVYHHQFRLIRKYTNI